MLSTIAKALGLLLFAIVVFVIFVAVWVYVIAAMIGVSSLLGLMWLLNSRFSVTQKGVKVGTYTRKGGFRKI
jgi:Na+/pantothenate symporter